MSLTYLCDKCRTPIKRPASIRMEISHGYELTIRKVPGEGDRDLCESCALNNALAVLLPPPRPEEINS